MSNSLVIIIFWENSATSCSCSHDLDCFLHLVLVCLSISREMVGFQPTIQDGSARSAEPICRHLPDALSIYVLLHWS